MNAPLVSVIIPAYQNADFLNQAVESVTQQTFKDFELIVVDDGSGDETVSRYRLPEGATLIREEHRCQAAALNSGIPAAKGKYLAFLDQDDVWLPEKLQKQVDFLETHPDLALVFCHTLQVDLSLNPMPQDREPVVGVADALEMMITGCFIRSPSTVMVRRDVAVEVGMFDEALSYILDRDFYIRCARKYRFGSMPEVLTFYRMHPGQLHTQKLGMLAGQCYVYDKTLAWARQERPDLVNHVRHEYAMTLRLAGKTRMCYEHNPRAAISPLTRAIRLWPFDRLMYWYLIRALIGSVISPGHPPGKK